MVRDLFGVGWLQRLTILPTRLVLKKEKTFQEETEKLSREKYMCASCRCHTPHHCKVKTKHQIALFFPSKESVLLTS